MPAVNEYIGRVVSLHRDPEHAARAERRLQRLTQRSSGRSSYVPTKIVRLARRMRAGEMVERADVAEYVDRYEAEGGAP
jgi:hypothetical protein